MRYAGWINMKSKKSSLAFKFLIAAIMAFFVMVAILNLVRIEGSAFSHLIPRTACKESVELNSALHIKTFDPPSRIKCPTDYVEFGKDNVRYQYGGLDERFDLPASQNERENAVKRAMADEIYQCWNQFGEGRKDLFGGPKKYCSVCSVFHFDGKDSEIRGFYSYLMSNTVPDDELARKGITYFDYMQGYSKKGIYDKDVISQNRKLLDETPMDTSKSYAVVFVYVKSDQFWENTMEVLKKFWDSDGGKVAVIGGSIALVGGSVIALAGVGTTAVGGVLLSALGIVQTTALTEGIFSAISAYSGADVKKDWSAFTIFGVYDENMLKGLGCEDIPTSDKNI